MRPCLMHLLSLVPTGEAQIRKDLGRTFPDHARFSSDEGRAALNRVLKTVACFLPAVLTCDAAL